LADPQSQPATRGRPGTPSLLRELNDRAALDLLLGGELLTRSQIGEYTGVSKVTVGLATILGGRLHRGTAGAAGEIGYLPVHGAPLHTDIRHPASGGFQSLAGGSAVRELAARHGFAAQTPAEAGPRRRLRRTQRQQRRRRQRNRGHRRGVPR
jgi:hypothetical protein